MPPAIEITALRKSFGDHEVLKGIDLAVQKGEVIAIVGKSGSGKSTLLRCINGLESFQSGRIVVDGDQAVDSDPTALRSEGLTRVLPDDMVGRFFALSFSLDQMRRNLRELDGQLERSAGDH